MLTYKHKIWSRNISRFIESSQFDSFKFLFLFLSLFIVILIFASKITNTINKGLEAQRRTDKLAAEVSMQEKVNQELKYQKELYSSDTEIEAQYRELENKKKKGELIYRISVEGSKKTSLSSEDNSQLDTNGEDIPNWQKWVEIVFR